MALRSIIFMRGNLEQNPTVDLCWLPPWPGSAGPGRPLVMLLFWPVMLRSFWVHALAISKDLKFQHATHVIPFISKEFALTARWCAYGFLC